MSANQKMKTTQLILIKLRNRPSTSSQSAGKWWPQLLFSHQPWTPEKEILQTNISYCLDSETESRKYLQISVQKSQCRFLSMFPRQIPLAYGRTCGRVQILPPTQFLPFSRYFPDTVRLPVPYKPKLTFLARHWRGKSGRNFRYAGQLMQFTFSDHPYVKRGLCVVFQAGLNTFTSEVMCAVALGFQSHFLDWFSYVQVKTIVLKWKDIVIEGNNVE